MTEPPNLIRSRDRLRSPSRRSSSTELDQDDQPRYRLGETPHNDIVASHQVTMAGPEPSQHPTGSRFVRQDLDVRHDEGSGVESQQEASSHERSMGPDGDGDDDDHEAFTMLDNGVRLAKLGARLLTDNRGQVIGVVPIGGSSRSTNWAANMGNQGVWGRYVPNTPVGEATFLKAQQELASEAYTLSFYPVLGDPPAAAEDVSTDEAQMAGAAVSGSAGLIDWGGKTPAAPSTLSAPAVPPTGLQDNDSFQSLRDVPFAMSVAWRVAVIEGHPFHESVAQCYDWLKNKRGPIAKSSSLAANLQAEKLAGRLPESMVRQLDTALWKNMAGPGPQIEQAPAMPSSDANLVRERSSGEDDISMSKILTSQELVQSTTDLLSARHRDGTEDARVRTEGKDTRRSIQPDRIIPRNEEFMVETFDWDTLDENPAYSRMLR